MEGAACDGVEILEVPQSKLQCGPHTDYITIIGKNFTTILVTCLYVAVSGTGHVRLFISMIYPGGTPSKLQCGPQTDYITIIGKNSGR